MPSRTPRQPSNGAATRRGILRGTARGIAGMIRRLPWILRLPVAACLAAAVALAVTAAVYGLLSLRYDLSELGRMPERSIVYDAAGGEIGRIHGENRVVVPLDRVSPLFLKALLAREDSRFFRHAGVDWVGVLRALMRTVKDRELVQGASTITMQLARNSYNLTRRKSLHRKLLEIAITLRIEAGRTKEEILELYVNRIFFGTGIYGVERAAQLYFGVSAADLSLDQAAMLAAIIRGPNRFSPFRHYETAVSGRNMVLDRMVVTGMLAEEEAEKAKSARTRVLPPPEGAGDSWALNAVRRRLADLLDDSDIEEGGLRIYTTIDPALQEVAEAGLATQLNRTESAPGYRHETWREYDRRFAKGGAPEPSYLQGAVLLLENSTGAIRAVVGGRDPRHTSFNRAFQAKRQAGSTFKPFVYAAAMENSPLYPGMLISDGPIAPGELRSVGGSFNPANSDGTHKGMQPAWWGLAASRNTMAVRVGDLAGIDAVREMAERAAMAPDVDSGAQLFLGNVGVTLENLTAAFAAIPNGGLRFRPFLIDRIESADGELLYRSGVMSHQLMSPGSAWMLAMMLQKTLEPGSTGAAVRQHGFRGLAGGKTGTTDDYHDAWFVGFTPRMTCGVWVGLDQPEPIIPGGYGSRIALPVWAGVMRKADPSARPGEQWTPPPGLTRLTVCELSGRLAVRECGRHARVADLPEEHATYGPCTAHGPHKAAPVRSAPRGRPVEKPSFMDRVRRLLR